jgi:hypothetical protein
VNVCVLLRLHGSQHGGSRFNFCGTRYKKWWSYPGCAYKCLTMPDVHLAEHAVDMEHTIGNVRGCVDCAIGLEARVLGFRGQRATHRVAGSRMHKPGVLKWTRGVHTSAYTPHKTCPVICKVPLCQAAAKQRTLGMEYTCHPETSLTCHVIKEHVGRRARSCGRQPSMQ